MQHAITKSLTPSRLTISVVDDPYDAAAPLSVTATVFAADETVLASTTVQLRSLERDYLDTLVRVATECWQWGAPAQQLRPAMQRVKSAARAHRKAHEG